MPKYKAAANVLGLQTGDTFSSDDAFYKTYADAGWFEVEESSDGEVHTEPTGTPSDPGGSIDTSASGPSDTSSSSGSGALPG